MFNMGPMIKYCGSGIPHNWDISYELWKIWRLPIVVVFPENWFPRQEQIFFKHECQWFYWFYIHSIGCNITLGSVLNVIYNPVEPISIVEQ